MFQNHYVEEILNDRSMSLKGFYAFVLVTQEINVGTIGNNYALGHEVSDVYFHIEIRISHLGDF